MIQSADTMTPAAKVAALYAALDWLEANPDKAITHDSATDDTGFPVAPGDPSATCFCFVGRVQREVKHKAFGFSLWLLELGTSTDVFIAINDAPCEKAERFRALRRYIDDIAATVPAA